MMQPAFMSADFLTATNEGTAEERDFSARLRDDGYAIIDLGIPDFDRIAQAVIARTGQLAPLRQRIQDGWRTVQEIRQIATNEKVLRLLSFAYGRRAIPFQTLNFQVGTQQKTHSDTIHFDSFPRNFMCGAWVAYEDATPENGALHYYAGSHKLPALMMEDLGLHRATLATRTSAYEAYERGIARVIAEHGLQKTVAPVKKGQALIWTANLFHGGEPIQNKDCTRHSQVTHYYFENCVYTQPLWSDFHAGRISYKKVFDISAGRYVTSRYNDRDFRLPVAAHLRELYSSGLRGVRVG